MTNTVKEENKMVMKPHGDWHQRAEISTLEEESGHLNKIQAMRTPTDMLI